jgi:hypothetical protein
VIDFENWFQTRKDKIIAVVRKRGQMWDQRK